MEAIAVVVVLLVVAEAHLSFPALRRRLHRRDINRGKDEARECSDDWLQLAVRRVEEEEEKVEEEEEEEEYEVAAVRE